MYTQFFQLKQSPFSIAPDPRYLYMSERHREALAHLLYGVGSGGGFVLLTGEIGAGKTTVCRCFMEQIPANCELGYIFNPRLTVEELLQSVCEEFRIAMPEGLHSVKSYIDAINRHLLASHAAGRNNVLIIDEAQNLSPPVLEQLRLLTNLETSERKLLQIILIGQPELRTMLARPELEQLAQRVIARYHLGSLSVEETGSYIGHRLAVAGAHGAPFPRQLMSLIHRMTGGVPRRINLLCDRALLGAYVENTHTVTRAILRRAGAEVFTEAAAAAPPSRRRWQYAAAGVLAGAVLTGAAAWQLLPAMKSPQAALSAMPGAGAAPGAQAAAVTQAALGAPGTQRGPVAGADVQTATSGAAAGQADAALRQLAELWGQQVPDGDFCASAAKLNLRCLHGKGGLEELRSLDRPAVLQLTDGRTSRYAVLASLDGRNAVLRTAGKTENITADTLALRFDGAYTTLWRAPRAWRGEVVEGDRGPDVDWLARRLAEMNGARKPRDNRPLDSATLQLLRDFQQAQGLKVDGVAGPKTMIRLQQLAGVQEPRLAHAAAAVAGK
ncbi:ExeA family protein [Pseudoduganella ginsengisoli]|uniref:AAA family ATPase n=1 Tax=Pseudoduganella ginsengisoli TaxID=1462440 RepID=A0A6L6Q943_9BURK|nr:ExeA family protein [Pseudoduganella ginsengisoli]MTW05732.1 AAA family ATPase [Pseudoduganella ginsengisoli]